MDLGSDPGFVFPTRVQRASKWKLPDLVGSLLQLNLDTQSYPVKSAFCSSSSQPSEERLHYNFF
uniref:Uncharacterized protein n=1 Tax=Megaselia scalaris TaxID=36166 RepID=T1GVT8_MEGSC